MRISDMIMKQYYDTYPEDDIGIEENSGGRISIYSPNTGKNYLQPRNETEETFIDRIERSRQTGRNLFYEEWETFEYEDDCYY